MFGYNLTNIRIYVSICLGLLMSACASVAPVQEMSNARQSLHLAKAVKAHVYATKRYAKAQEFLDQAVNQLNSGDYIEARRFALQAADEAKQAHLIALNQRKK